MTIKLLAPGGLTGWIVYRSGVYVFVEGTDRVTPPDDVDPENDTVIEIEVTVKGLRRARTQMFWH